MADDPQDSRVTAIGTICAAFTAGNLRLSQARFFARQVSLVTLQLHDSARELPDNFAEIKELLAAFRSEYVTSFDYVANISDLIYVTTLFDTFLSDITKFLLLSFPKAAGKNTAVTLESLIDGSSRETLIDLAVSKRARELGFAAFKVRLEFLRDTFGVSINLEPQILTTLGHYAGVRNVVVHDHSSCEHRLHFVGSRHLFESANAGADFR